MDEEFAHDGGEGEFGGFAVGAESEMSAPRWTRGEFMVRLILVDANWPDS